MEEFERDYARLSGHPSRASIRGFETKWCSGRNEQLTRQHRREFITSTDECRSLRSMVEAVVEREVVASLPAIRESADPRRMLALRKRVAGSVSEQLLAQIDRELAEMAFVVVRDSTELLGKWTQVYWGHATTATQLLAAREYVERISREAPQDPDCDHLVEASGMAEMTPAATRAAYDDAVWDCARKADWIRPYKNYLAHTDGAHRAEAEARLNTLRQKKADRKRRRQQRKEERKRAEAQRERAEMAEERAERARFLTQNRHACVKLATQCDAISARRRAARGAELALAQVYAGVCADWAAS